MVFVYNPQASSIRLFLTLFTVYVFGAGHWATFLGKDVELQKKGDEHMLSYRCYCLKSFDL